MFKIWIIYLQSSIQLVKGTRESAEVERVKIGIGLQALGCSAMEMRKATAISVPSILWLQKLEVY
ncbi:conserved hypothetical protein [Ricinus communis]|uniref:Uncharacterized protein n=1 Tax=Ricinus communis TaxID=3988 RepID=B9RIX5_RICCO|nr:conserved hypothetical protein [Ricinus communis]